MTRGWFVTATDTDVGKTHVSGVLLRALAGHGQRVAGMKPVASGCTHTPEGWRSSDALALMAASNVVAAYDDVNPYALIQPTAPHLAARAQGVDINIALIQSCYQRLAAQANAVIVEGIGGWQVPLGPDTTMVDVVRALALPVVLVVPLRVGALNHALLTQAAIQSAGCRLAGWVANQIDPLEPEGYRQALSERLLAPCIGAVPHGLPSNTPALLNVGMLLDT